MWVQDPPAANVTYPLKKKKKKKKKRKLFILEFQFRIACLLGKSAYHVCGYLCVSQCMMKTMKCMSFLLVFN